MNKQKGILSEVETAQLVHAIQEAELRTSGEIRVHIEQIQKKVSMDRAVEVFYALGMDKTINRNGVLLYVCMNTHSFIIIGDEGINKQVPGDYWNTIKDEVISFFKEGKIKDGLVRGVELVGQKLVELYPSTGENKDELPNEITSHEDLW